MSWKSLLFHAAHTVVGEVTFVDLSETLKWVQGRGTIPRLTKMGQGILEVMMTMTTGVVEVHHLPRQKGTTLPTVSVTSLARGLMTIPTWTLCWSARLGATESEVGGLMMTVTHPQKAVPRRAVTVTTAGHLATAPRRRILYLRTLRWRRRGLELKSI